MRGVLVVEELFGADGAGLVLAEGLFGDAVERVEVLLADAGDLGGRAVDVGLEGLDEGGEEAGVVVVGGRREEGLELLLEEVVQGGGVDGRGGRVRVRVAVLLGRRGGGVGREVGEEGGEGGHVDAAGPGLGGGPGLDVVLDCV